MIRKLLIIAMMLAPNTIHIHRSIEELPNINQMPRMITMSIYDDAKTQMAFNYNTTWKTDTVIQINENEEDLLLNKNSLEFEGEVNKSKVANDGFIHRVVAKNLKPNTTYYYRLGDKNVDVWSDVSSFTTAEDKVGTRFVHISDPQGYEEVHYDNYNQLLKVSSEVVNPDFYCLTGDIVNDSYIDSTPKLEQWEWALTDQKEFMQKYPFMTVAGNHEASSDDYNSRFNHPVKDNNYQSGGSYYSFNYQGVHFVSLNTNDSDSSSQSAKGLSDAQIDWLKNDLEVDTSTFTVVMMHKGIYDAGGHCSNLEGADYDIPLIRKQLSPIFSEYKVDLVLQGHDHLFSRSYPLNGEIENDELKTTTSNASKEEVVFENTNYEIYNNPNGTIYLNTGTASGSKYYAAVDYDEEEIPLEKVDSPSHRMFTEIVIEDNTLYAKTYKIIDGEAVVFDTFGVKKSNDNETPKKDDDKDNKLIIIIVASVAVLGIAASTLLIIKRKKTKA